MYYLHSIASLHNHFHVAQIRYRRGNQVVMANYNIEINNYDLVQYIGALLADNKRIFALFQPPLYLLVHWEYIRNHHRRKITTANIRQLGRRLPNWPDNHFGMIRI